MNRLKKFLGLVKAHPTAFLAFGVLFAMVAAAPLFAIVNRAKAAVPPLAKLPDLKVRGA